MEVNMRFPEDLLRAVSLLEKGQIVLVVGAGCSIEPPTDLPLSKDLSLEAHRKLVSDSVLNDGECPNPSDLSILAESVFKKTGSQRELVARFPNDKFRTASPNEGHLIAAALLYEQIISCVITLNFDLAFSNALAHVGTGESVTIINKPEDHGKLGLANLVYLHGNVDVDPDQWVLRETISDEKWRIGWQKLVTLKMITSPVTIFIGLGSPIGVMEHSALLILNELHDLVKVYQVDPQKKEDSAFFQKLRLPDDSYLQMTWTQFMQQLSLRLVEEHRAGLLLACMQLISQEGWDDNWAENLCRRFTSPGLIALGKIRARWTLAPSTYQPRRNVDPQCLADLLLAVGFIENRSNSEAVFHSGGSVEFRQGNAIIKTMLFAHGRGVTHWNAMEAKLKQSPQFREYIREYNYERSVIAIVSGVNGEKPTCITPPTNIIYQENPYSLIPNNEGLNMITIGELRQQPNLVTEVMS